MERDTIAQIELDSEGRLHVVPAAHSFPYIYREAMEVHWDSDRRSLHSPKPRQWSYSRWLQQLLSAAATQGCELRFATDTRWVNIDPGLKAELLQVTGSGA
nr:hypothetical protein [uncultured bacterium]